MFLNSFYISVIKLTCENLHAIIFYNSKAGLNKKYSYMNLHKCFPGSFPRYAIIFRWFIKNMEGLQKQSMKLMLKRVKIFAKSRHVACQHIPGILEVKKFF